MDWSIARKYLDNERTIRLNCNSQFSTISQAFTDTNPQGPKRLFQESLFYPVPYGFLAGAITPLILFGLHKLFPRAKFQLWNSTIFFAGLSYFYGNISTGYFSSIIGGFVVMFWAYRYRYDLWARYNYLLAAAFDAGYNLNLLLIFLFFGAGKVVTMPNWWGNNADSSDRCFALDKSA